MKHSMENCVYQLCGLNSNRSLQPWNIAVVSNVATGNLVCTGQGMVLKTRSALNTGTS